MFRSSGDPIADRRYAYAESAAREGDWRAAADVLEQTLELAPHWAPAWLALGEAREKLAEREGAAAAYRKALALDPEDALGARPRLSRLDSLPSSALPETYVRELFDDYAPRYEKHLTEGLAYRGPDLLIAALDAMAPQRRFALALDLGCGDGLMGAAVRRRVDTLIGVDLSPVMAAKARERKAYETIAAQEICAFLEGRTPGEVDLALAADALPYFGDLTRLFAAVSRVLAGGGLFAFTAEANEGESYRLGEGLRFAHSRAYLAKMGNDVGLAPRSLQQASARREKGRAAPGWVAVFERAK
jgi:predicted TPR repeat methyltransferase